MIFSFRRIIAYVSTFTTLVPGDVIVTGTPTGAGARLDPPVWLKPGDVVEVEADGIGLLCATAWSTRKAHDARGDRRRRCRSRRGRAHANADRAPVARPSRHDHGRRLCGPGRLGGEEAFRRPQGHRRKIGLTSKAMQAALSIDTPIPASCSTTCCSRTAPRFRRDRFIQPRIEAEIAFVMKADLKGDVTVDDVLDATDYVQPSLEILDTRILRADPETGRPAMSATPSPTTPPMPASCSAASASRRAVDLRWIGAIVMKNGEVEETGLGGGVLNHPAEGIVWLARRLAEYGDFIRAAKSCCQGPSSVRWKRGPGDLIVADFGAHGRVSCQF
jgi:2-oxo-hept-3-ene-1,7-dioate hydratase